MSLAALRDKGSVAPLERGLSHTLHAFLVRCKPIFTLRVLFCDTKKEPIMREKIP